MSEDIPQLAANILAKHCRELGATIPELSQAAASALSRHAFPGNVRELENVLERALALCNGSAIESEDLLLEASSQVEDDDLLLPAGDIPLPEYLESIERKILLDALGKTGNNKTAAAKLLGVSFRTLRYRLAKLGLGKD